MKSHYRAVIIGGGIVGSSVLYHLAKFGWADVALIERGELTCGSTWHAAGGFHALNDDPNIAALQGYTIRLYDEIQRESGVSVGMHMTGGISLAASAERMEMLKAERSMYETMEIETRIVTPEEIRELCPIVDVSGLQGGLYDAHEGYMDPHGTTHAYIGAAKKLAISNFAFSGHIHPGVRVSGGGRQSLQFPCFYFTPAFCVLPAFSRFTGLAMIRPKETDQVFAIVNQSIIPL